MTHSIWTSTRKTKDLQVYVNGRFYPIQKAMISVTDRAFLYGDGVFEGIMVVDGNIFELEQHIDRLYRSAKTIRIRVTISKNEMKEAIVEVIKRNDLRNGYVRPILSRGEGPLGLERVGEIRGPSLVIIPQIREMMNGNRGYSARTVTIKRVPPESLDPRVKSCNYLTNVLAKFEQKDAGADVGIMLDIHGYVAEACAENIFVVRDGVLYTPYPTHILDGITRRATMKLARRFGIAVVESNMTKYDLYTADEVFVTGSLAGIAPITNVDNMIVGNGKIGKMTRRLMAALHQAMRTEGVRALRRTTHGNR